MWRLTLHLPRPGALLLYERAIRLCGYVERANQPNSSNMLLTTCYNMFSNAGPFLETMWRLTLRLPRTGALLSYERAIRLRGYVERANRPNLLARENAMPDFASLLQ
jgi:hypothetical protein